MLKITMFQNISKMGKRKHEQVHFYRACFFVCFGWSKRISRKLAPIFFRQKENLSEVLGNDYRG
jgi:hypothetical protein